MTTATIIEESKASYEVREHLCRHQLRSCPKCPRCFHGWHRCAWCWRARSGLPPEKPRRPRARCAACGRFRRPPGPECDRCRSFGFEALTLF